jgi:hypothetical protein
MHNDASIDEKSIFLELFDKNNEILVLKLDFKAGGVFGPCTRRMEFWIFPSTAIENMKNDIIS